MSKQKKNGKLSRRDRHNADQSKGGRRYVQTVWVGAKPAPATVVEPKSVPAPAATPQPSLWRVSKAVAEKGFGFLRNSQGESAFINLKALPPDTSPLFVIGALLDCDVVRNATSNARYRVTTVRSIRAPEALEASAFKWYLHTVVAHRGYGFLRNQHGQHAYLPLLELSEEMRVSCQVGVLVECTVIKNQTPQAEYRVTRVHAVHLPSEVAAAPEPQPAEVRELETA